MTAIGLMLDTNIVSDFMRFPQGRVGQRLMEYALGSVAMSVIVVSELRYGVSRVQSERLRRQVERTLNYVQVLPLNASAAFHYADIRAHLAGAGRPIGPNDCFIAAHALDLGVPLVTDNVREFSRVPGLRVENWLD